MLRQRSVCPFRVVFSIACLLMVVVQAAFAQTSDTAVAKVNGRTILLKDVDESIQSQLIPLQAQIYALRKVALDNLVSRVILEQTARDRNISLEELKRQLTSGKVEVTPDQIDQLYFENALAFGAMSVDEVKERLRLDLESRARMKLYRDALAEMTRRSQVEVWLEEPRIALGPFNEAAALGPAAAKVTIVEFSDFQCPYCRTSQQSLRQILREYGDRVRLVFKHLPLDIHEQAFPAAIAAYCAGEQRQFWAFQDALFAANELSAETFHKIAAGLRIDNPEFKLCLSSSSARSGVLADIRLARQLGFNSTPTFLVNGKIVQGAIGYDEFKRIVEKELSAAENARPK